VKPAPILLVHASLLMTAFLWGGNATAIKYLLRDLAPTEVMFLRCAAAAGFFAIVLLLTGRPLIPLRRGDALRLIGIGLLGVTILNIAFVAGTDLVPATLAALIVTSNPIHTAVISRVLLGEALTRRKLAGIGLAFLGLLIVVLLGVGERGSLDPGHLKGVGIVALGPFAWAFYTVFSKPLLTRYPPVHVAAYTTIAGALVFLPLPFVRAGTLAHIGALDARGWGAALFASLFSFVLGYILWYRGLRVLAPSQAAVYIYFVPVFGLLVAWLVLDERPTLFLLLGGAAILAGVILTNSTPRSSPRSAGPIGPAPVVAHKVSVAQASDGGER
jgi:drug/metabolite transporter (DMT)-like permease